MMNNIIFIFLLISAILLFVVSLAITRSYPYAQKISNIIQPKDDSQSLQNFIEFLDDNKPKSYKIKNNKHE